MTACKNISPEFVRDIESIVGSEFCHVGDAVNEDFTRDEMPIYGSYAPDLVCEPNSTEQVAAIMRTCYEADVPVTVRGAGTGLVSGCVALNGGVVLCTMRMNEIIEYDMNNLFVRVQPGVRLCDLAADALTHDLMYPPDPGEKTASIGGNVSTNAGGMRAVKYGTTRDYVLAMTVVLPSGEILEIGRPVTKTSTGYSLLHLMIGSEGTLGIITEITLRLIPNPTQSASFLLPFADIHEAIGSVPALKLAGLDPRAIEFMERDIVDSSAAHTGNHIIPTTVDGKQVGAYIIVTLDGNDEDEIFARAEVLAQVADDAGAYDTLVLQGSEQRQVWELRGAFLSVIEAEERFIDEMDVVVPVDSIAAFLAFVHQEGQKVGLRIRSFGHAGDGNLHIYCCCADDIGKEEFLIRDRQVMDASYAECARLNGQVSGEHGIGSAKSMYLRQSVGDTSMQIMAGIKAVFDPKGILNPGKICS